MMRRLIPAILLLSLCLFAMPLSATAFDPFGQVDCSGDQAQSAVCTSKTSQNPIAGTDGVLAKITDIIAYIAAAGAIIVLIVGGIRYITSGGDAAKVTSAKGTVINALIGIAVIVLAKAIITFVLREI